MSKLNMLIGLPGSGKSSFAREHLKSEKCIYLSSDEIRIEMFGFEDQTHNSDVFEKMKKESIEALKSGFDVIYDATNISKKYRKDIINKAKEYGEVNAYLMCCSIGELLERNIIRSERHLPWDKLVQMIKNINCPMYYEGFDNIFLVNTSENKYFMEYEYLFNKCYNFKQENPYHKETLEEHLKWTSKESERLGSKLILNDQCVLETSAMWHDIGKLYTKMFNDKKNYYVYYGHENVSTYLFLCSRSYCRTQRLNDSCYQIAALIQNHMEWYKRDDMKPIKEQFNDDDLYKMLELLHEADKYREII